MSDTPVPSTPETQQAAAPTSEVVKPIPEVVEAKPQSVSPQFMALAKKERAIRAEALKLQAERAELASQREQVTKYNSLRETAKLNPIEALEALGITYADVTNYKLNNGRPTPEAQIDSVRGEIEALRKEREEQRLAQEQHAVEQAKAENEAVVTEFKEEISSFISTNAQYDMLPLYPESADIIYTTMEDYYKETGKVLSLEEGARMVDDYLADMIRPALASKRFAPPAPVVPVIEDPEAGFATRQPKTLSNAISPPPSVLAPRTDEERRQRALAALMRK